MTRAILTLNAAADRRRATDWIAQAPAGTRVAFMGPRRTNDQNALLWAALTDVASQVTHHGLRLSTTDWKDLFMASLNTEARLVPNLDGNGFVALGRSTSKLSKAEFGDLIELIFAFGAREGVTFSEPGREAA